MLSSLLVLLLACGGSDTEVKDFTCGCSVDYETSAGTFEKEDLYFEEFLCFEDVEAELWLAEEVEACRANYDDGSGLFFSCECACDSAASGWTCS